MILHKSDFEKMLACRCPCGQTKADPLLLEKLEKLQERIKAPLIITSGYRCPKHNNAIKGAKGSYHVKGMAADVTCAKDLLLLYFESVAIFKDHGVGLYPDNRFVHVDVRPYRARWGKVDGSYCPITRAFDKLKERKRDATNPDASSQ